MRTARVDARRNANAEPAARAAWRARQAADSFNTPQLKSTCLNYMVSNFKDVVRTEAFKELVAKETRGLVVKFLEEASARLVLNEPRGVGGGRSAHF